VAGDTASDATAEGRWDVALSFAGTQRDYVAQVAAALRARGVRAFYDADEQVRLWGTHLAEELPRIYAQESAAVVVFVSADYAQGDWTRLERRAAFSRAVTEAGVYVLPARFGDSELPGLLPDVVSVDLRELAPERFADLVAAKLVILGIIPRGESAPSGQLPDVWDTAVWQPGWPVEQLDDPFVLEVHPAIDAGARAAGLPALPAYVPRSHDLRLRDTVRRAVGGHSAVALLVGGSSTGKTRACWEVVKTLPASWRLWHPINPGRPEAALAELPRIGPRTVVWLNEAQHYLLTPASELGERVAAGLRELLRDPGRRPVLVLSTIWPEYWADLATAPTPGQPDPHAQARALLTGADIPVPDAFTGPALAALHTASGGDPRLAEAMEHAEKGQVTQYLAGAPALLERYRNAPPAAKALIEAAMDARRLGHDLALPHAFLEAAAPGYLSDQQWDALGEDWLDQALAYTAAPCRGARGPLTRIRPRPGQPGYDQPHYRLADYLDQHARTTRRVHRAPAALWNALLAHATDADAPRLADSARSRRLDRYAISLYRRAATTGDGYADYRLAELLAHRGDLDGLRVRAVAGDGHAADRLAELATQLDEHYDVHGATEVLQVCIKAGGHPSHALVNRLTERGDPKDPAELRGGAEAGDRPPADLLAERGDLDGLRARVAAGDGYAAYRLADLLIEHADLDGAIEVLRARAEAGDRKATHLLARQLADHNDLDGFLDALHVRMDIGDGHAAELLAEHGALDGAIEVLRARADTGDRMAAYLLADLLVERGDVDGLQARVAVGDGYAAYLLARQLAKRGDLGGAIEVLRVRVDAGDRNAADPLADLLHECGRWEEAERLRRFGFNPDGSIASGTDG
jgi:hypothetical protein